MIFENHSQRPTANPKRGTLGCDDIQLCWRGKPADPTETIKYVFEVIKERPLETIGISIFVWFTCIIINYMFEIPSAILPELLEGIAPTTIELIVLPFKILSTTISLSRELIVCAALSLMWLRILRRQPFEPRDLTNIVPLLPRIIGTAIIIGVLSWLGIIFLVVPGVIFWLGFSMAPLLILDKNLGVWEALRASWRITKGHKGKLFVLNFYLSLLNILGVLCCGLGLLITIPITYGAIASFYNDLVVAGNAYQQGELNEDIFR